uniref:ARAD1C03718p n=1 Tax=Blastobotrys adeninivorans TaxID=409370 RepID=A0A060SZB0_BLAAD
MPIPKLPQLPATTDPWGPPAQIPAALRFNDVPYAPFSKGDKLGRVADWAADQTQQKDQKTRQHGRGFRDPYHAYGANVASFFTADDAEDVSSFSVVDSSKAPARPRGSQSAVLKTRGGRQQASRPQAGNAAPSGAANRGQGGANRGWSSRDRQFRGGGRRLGWGNFDKPQKVRDASVAITDDWKPVQTIGFNNLQKLSFESRPGQSVGDYGFVQRYDRSLDKAVLDAPLKPVDKVVYNVSTSEDPVISELSESGVGTVFATDTIIALLMCSTKSVIPWDIVINKRGGKIFLDKREGGPLDFVSVDENAVDPPAESTDKDNINSASSLAVEATYINHNFGANAVSESSSRYEFPKPNPFDSGDGAAALAQGYRYRKFNLANNVEEDEPLYLVVRGTVNAVQTSASGAEELVTVHALNEYGGSGNLEWKAKFVNQRGAIVAAEMKNNLNKLSRWTVESVLAGANLMKIGFVSRVAPKDNTRHVVVGVLGRDPAQFSQQLNINMANGWGIVKSIVNIATELEDGKYVLIKDPNYPQIKLYQVPESTFEDQE